MKKIKILKKSILPETDVATNAMQCVKSEPAEDHDYGHNEVTYSPKIKNPKIEKFTENDVDAVLKTLLHGKPGNCPFCGKFRGKLKVHIIEIHKKNKPWNCDLCDYSTVSESSLKKHINAVHNDKGKYF